MKPVWSVKMKHSSSLYFQRIFYPIILLYNVTAVISNYYKINMKRIPILIFTLSCTLLSAQSVNDTAKVKTIEAVSLEGNKKL
jgi:hypothetical protein